MNLRPSALLLLLLFFIFLMHADSYKTQLSLYKSLDKKQKSNKQNVIKKKNKMLR